MLNFGGRQGLTHGIHQLQCSSAEFVHILCGVVLQVDRAVQDKQSAIVRAQGEAQSARLIGQAIQHNPAFITLRKIEVSLTGRDWKLLRGGGM